MEWYLYVFFFIRAWANTHACAECGAAQPESAQVFCAGGEREGGCVDGGRKGVPKAASPKDQQVPPALIVQPRSAVIHGTIYTHIQHFYGHTSISTASTIYTYIQHFHRHASISTASHHRQGQHRNCPICTATPKEYEQWVYFTPNECEPSVYSTPNECEQWVYSAPNKCE